nr:unnamed protein product [Callosobruchus analis]
MDMFKPPSALSEYDISNWQLWKQKFEIYLKASGKSAADDDIKIAVLLHCIGDEGLDVYNTFPDDKKSTLTKLLEAYDEHFLPKKVIPVETFKFNSLNQTSEQSIEQYLTVLKKQAKLCEFICDNDQCKKSFEERMIRDRLIVGIYDKQTQARLLREPNLNVDKIVEYCKSIHLTKEHLKTLNAESDEQQVNAVNRKIQCSKCLYEHVPNKCPAFGKTCAKCQKRGHFAKACRSMVNGADPNNGKRKEPQVNEVQASGCENSDEEEAIYVNECKTDFEAKAWYESLMVEGKHVKFKLDCGAQVSTMPLSLFRSLNLSVRLQKSKSVLVSYGNFRIKPIGEVVLRCSHKENNRNVKFVIIDCKIEPLLSLHDCENFHLIKRVNSVEILPKSKEEVFNNYKQVFEGIGQIPGVCSIKLAEDAKPVVQHQRKVPLALHSKLKETLQNLEDKKIISKVDYPTRWVNSLMIVEKPDKTLRICIDPKPLNKYILREHFQIPTNSDIISRLTGSSIFSVIDMKEGFWQLQLDDYSADLCVFNSPFGRFRFNRLPFGISSAPEIFQKKIFEIFGDIPGVQVYFDDIIIFGKDENSHDKALVEVLDRALKNNVKFKFGKLQYKLDKVNFLGHIISKDKIMPNDENIKAVHAIESPNNRSEVLRILGLVKFFSKFIPNLSELTKNLRYLTKKNIPFSWTSDHEKELLNLKSLITSSPILRIFDTSLPIVIQCDASSEALGCCILQEGHPVAFASRCLTESEKRWAQIEKELASIVFCFEKFHNYLYGFDVTVQTDHKPLVAIFSKGLDNVTARLQRMLLRLLKYRITITYLPGKDMVIADTLSRSYIKDEVLDDPEMEYIVHSLYNNVAMSQERKQQFIKEIDCDIDLSQVKQFCITSWPEKRDLTSSLKLYYKLKDDIYLSNNLLFLNAKVIVPYKLRKEMLALMHETHFGIEKTKQRARQIFYWPGMSSDVEQFIYKCEVCQTNRRSQQKETLVPHEMPSRPWQYIFSDFFEFQSKNFILLIDSYSNWIEVEQTKSKTAEEVINFCKNKFKQFGVPEIFFADNVPFNSSKFREFARKYNFEVRFSSPHYHQSNGLAERYVGIVKNMLKKCTTLKDLPVFIMEYHATPLPNMKYSPSQLFLNRLLKTKLPVSDKLLRPMTIDHKQIQHNLKCKQAIQKANYDKTARNLPALEIGDNVLIQQNKTWKKGKVVDKVNDRSYIVKDEFGSTLHRNRRFLIKHKLNSNLSSTQYDLLYDFDLNSNLSSISSQSFLDSHASVQTSIGANNTNCDFQTSPQAESIVSDDSQENESVSEVPPLCNSKRLCKRPT